MGRPKTKLVVRKNTELRRLIGRKFEGFERSLLGYGIRVTFACVHLFHEVINSTATRSLVVSLFFYNTFNYSASVIKVFSSTLRAVTHLALFLVSLVKFHNDLWPGKTRVPILFWNELLLSCFQWAVLVAYNNAANSLSIWWT
jgi:hypothetical protein